MFVLTLSYRVKCSPQVCVQTSVAIWWQPSMIQRSVVNQNHQSWLVLNPLKTPYATNGQTALPII